MDKIETYTAFDNTSIIAHGSLRDVILKTKKILGKSENSSFLIFSDSTGKTIDFNFQGTEKEILKRLEIFVSNSDEKIELARPGRPKLGVISREISLLPRHWEWLATQSSGASSSIRNLIEDAIKKSTSKVSLKQQQEKVYRVMTTLAGDLDGYEEAIRSLYKRDRESFIKFTKGWSKDLRSYLEKLTNDVFEVEE